MSKKRENHTTDEESKGYVEESINYLGPGNIIDGKIVLKGRTIVEGSVIKGKIYSTEKDSELVIGPGSEITGEIKSESIILNGTMDGKISSRKVLIQGNGVLVGEVITNRGLEVEVGAKMSATVRMKKKKQ
ncbi:MAG: polymer-forming cytoskeletal protein [Deltaproteobacteria bacterium]|uniref:Polymer-forming cytoskeletal protein n=1 Tax=Candidatus Zymogenus saltonus TaxID=2844893 RepID=A0A9D8KG20_9DELT|nr:polymer-forming cytoskeletal protein [Candidatus Zymogenus saltonus]